MSTPVDLVVSDVNMPEMDGIELLENTRNKTLNPKVSFILASTEEDEDIVERANLANVSAWVQKPFKVNDLLDAVEQALEPIKITNNNENT